MQEHTVAQKAIVNGQHIDLPPNVCIGREILKAAGCEPVDEHVLVQVTRPGSRAIGLDDEIHPGASMLEFHAFRCDRAFNFTIDGRGYVWGAPVISEGRLRDLSGIADDQVLVLEHKGQPGLELDDGSEINLAHGGTEHLRSMKGYVTVCFNGPDRQIPRKSYCTEELITLLGVEPGYLLNMMGHDKQLVTLKPGQHVSVRKGHKFISQAPCGGSS